MPVGARCFCSAGILPAFAQTPASAGRQDGGATIYEASACVLGLESPKRVFSSPLGGDGAGEILLFEDANQAQRLAEKAAGQQSLEHRAALPAVAREARQLGNAGAVQIGQLAKVED